MMPRTIHHTFGPHIDRFMLSRVLWQSYQPWSYVNGSAIEGLRQDLESYMPGNAHLFASGRQALLALLKALGIRSGEEVIVQGYTCVVVPNAIHAAGGVPIYADIDPQTLNLTLASVKEKITDRTRAVIVQHTFGIPAPSEELHNFLKEKNIVLIEDMAHTLPTAVHERSVGTIGDYALLSFGRDKAVSGVSGGAILSRNADTSQILSALEDAASNVSWWTVLKHLEYGPRMYSLVRPCAGTFFVKVCIKALTILRLIEPVLTEEEKNGKMPVILQKIPNACAALARSSFKKLSAHNEHRRMLTELYLAYAKKEEWIFPESITSDMPLQKFPLFVFHAEKIRDVLKAEKIFLQDGWNTCTICPESVDPSHCGYVKGSTKDAEDVSLHILNLPTHPLTTERDAIRLLHALKGLIQQKP